MIFKSKTRALGNELRRLAATGDDAGVQKLLASATCKDAANLADGDGNTPLHIAAGQGQVEVIRVLLASSANPRAYYKDGYQPMHQAAAGGHVTAIQALVAARVDPNVSSGRGKALRPLHVAAARDQGDAVQALLAAGASASARDARNCVPLHFAAAHGAPAATAALLVAGGAGAVGLGVHASCGNTPLHETIFGWKEDRALDYAKVVHALVEAGANPETFNCKHRSALSVASDLQLRHAQALMVQGVEYRRFDGVARAHTGATPRVYAEAAAKLGLPPLDSPLQMEHVERAKAAGVPMEELFGIKGDALVERERRSRGCGGCNPLCCSQCCSGLGDQLFLVKKDDTCGCCTLKVALVSAGIAALTAVMCFCICIDIGSGGCGKPIGKKITYVNGVKVKEETIRDYAF